MLGDRIEANDALALGILNGLLPRETFLDDVMEKAHRLASGPSNTIAAIKKCTSLGADGSLADVLSAEQSEQASLFLSDNAREGMRAFVEKRAPQFK